MRGLFSPYTFLRIATLACVLIVAMNGVFLHSSSASSSVTTITVPDPRDFSVHDGSPRHGKGDRVRLRMLDDLSFGTFTAGGRGEVVLDPASGGCRATGNVAMIHAEDCSAGSLVIYGPAGAQVMLRFSPVTRLTADGGDKGNAIKMKDFTLDTGEAGRSILLPPSGRKDVRFGATIDVPARVNAGVYHGVFEVEAITFNE